MKIITTKITLSEAQRLPNLLGHITSAMLAAHGVYTCTINKKKIRFILKKAAS